MTEIVVTLSTLPRRVDFLEDAIGELRAIADVRVHLAPLEDDPGPVWKWIAPQAIEPGAVVVVVDDDLHYTRRHVEALVDRLDAEPGLAPMLLQGCGYAVRIRDNAPERGGPFLDGRAVEVETRTDIVQAFAGVALRGCDFLELRHKLARGVDALRHAPSPLWDLARVSDDYLVSSAWRRCGFAPPIALPMAPPVELPCSHDAGALCDQEPGHVARYTMLAGLDAELARRAGVPPWWGGSP